MTRGERVLQITGQSLEQTKALLDLVGEEGRVLLVEADRGQAEVIRQLDHHALSVLAHVPQKGESFGLFDALFACPLRMPKWPRERWGDLASQNLRPGGRFLIDLPAEDFCNSLAKAWLQAGGSREQIACWSGPSESQLVESLGRAGLRRIEASLGTHLLRSESPRRLAEGSVSILGAESEMVESLHLALTEILGTTGAIELVCRRTRVKGMR